MHGKNAECTLLGSTPDILWQWYGMFGNHDKIYSRNKLQQKQIAVSARTALNKRGLGIRIREAMQA